jgi:hypothetical protein
VSITTKNGFWFADIITTPYTFSNKLVENPNLFFGIVYQLENLKPITVEGGANLAPLGN